MSNILFLPFEVCGTHAAHSGACPVCLDLPLYLVAAQPLSGEMRRNADVARQLGHITFGVYDYLAQVC